MNLAISGWNGAGTSTLCLILAKNLNLKLLQGTQTFRYIGKELNYNNTGIDRIKVDEYLEDHWGPLYDKYVDHVLLNYDKHLIESDIAAFRLGKHQSFFSIFLIADQKIRAERLHVDERKDDVDVLKIRDESLRTKYKELHGIDWMNTQEIVEKYNLVIDNTEMSISDELTMIYEKLKQSDFINDAETRKLTENSMIEDKNFWNTGKESYIKYLEGNDLLIKAEQIITDIRNTFPKEISNLPKELVNIVDAI